MPKLLLLPLLLVFAVGLDPAAAEIADAASYEVRFQADWSAATHPEGFPASGHFSSLIGGVHGPGVVFFEDGGLASDGIEAMAERGATSQLAAEVGAAIAAGNAREVIRGGGIGRSPGSASADFTASRDFPLVSLTSMVAPSPDWFVGVSALSLIEQGHWVLRKVVTLYARDAGTDSGVSYVSPDRNTVPPEPIRFIDEGPLGNHMPLGTFTFVRQHVPPPEVARLNRGRFEVSVEWRDFELHPGNGKAFRLSDDTAYFWFFTESNAEMMVKVLNACGFNGYYWVFAGGLTNVEVTLKVEDTRTGQVKVYGNPLGATFQPIQDTSAFATCP